MLRYESREHHPLGGNDATQFVAARGRGQKSQVALPERSRDFYGDLAGGFRLELQDADGDNFFLSDSGSLTAQINLRAGLPGTAGRIAVRSDLQATPSLLSTGELSAAAREVLEARVADLERRYPAGNIPRPTDWGGYRLSAEQFEFWQGREGRLHDRFRYTLDGDAWRIGRLQP